MKKILLLVGILALVIAFLSCSWVVPKTPEKTAGIEIYPIGTSLEKVFRNNGIPNMFRMKNDLTSAVYYHENCRFIFLFNEKDELVAATIADTEFDFDKFSELKEQFQIR